MIDRSYAGKLAEGRRLRVVMVTGGAPPTGSPVARGIFNVRAAAALSQAVDLSVVRLRAWAPGRPPVVEFQENGIPGLSLALPHVPFATPVGLEVFKRWGWRYVKGFISSCDIIHSVYASFNGVVASYWAKKARVHHVANVIGSDFHIDLVRSRWIRSGTGWQHHVHAVACESRMMTEEFQKMYPEARNVRTVYRGVDLGEFTPSCKPFMPRTNESGARFLYIGGFPYYEGPYGSNTKGGWTLCEAWKAAEPELVAAGSRLFLAGPGVPNRRLRKWLRTLSHPERVSLLGILNPNHMPGLISSCDVILIPSFIEGLPNIVLEAAACARVAVGSRIGGLEDAIDPGVTGLLVEPGDVSAWKEALLSQARPGPASKSMGERARKRVEAAFDSRQYAPQMLDLYTQALSEPLTDSSGDRVLRESYEVQADPPAPSVGGSR